MHVICVACICVFACLRGLQKWPLPSGCRLYRDMESRWEWVLNICCAWKYSKIGMDDFSNHNCTETPFGRSPLICVLTDIDVQKNARHTAHQHEDKKGNSYCRHTVSEIILSFRGSDALESFLFITAQIAVDHFTFFSQPPASLHGANTLHLLSSSVIYYAKELTQPAPSAMGTLFTWCVRPVWLSDNHTFPLSCLLIF